MYCHTHTHRQIDRWTDRQTDTQTDTGDGRMYCSRRGETENQLEMWANAQRDGRPAEHRWRHLFNAAKFG